MKIKCGLEIHQQLDGKKLFCSCPAILREDTPHFSVKRRLHISAGEQGDVDIAAKKESEKDRLFTYQGYRDSTCLVELDESPPQPINESALLTVLTFAKLVNAKPVDRVHVMRKTVLDGSNTSGFQRTALIAAEGFIETSKGKVGIASILLEEDSAKIIRSEGASVLYCLDRLGIPLIKVGTHPDIKDPEHALEVAQKLGMLLRSLPNIKRGLGTIRQDLNVSIEGGSRCEIKGAQDLKTIPKWIEIEALRQKSLIEIKNELSKRSAINFTSNILDLTHFFKHSSSSIIAKGVSLGKKILGVKLPNFNGLIGVEIQPGKRLGTEFSEHAKKVPTIQGIFHGDELPAYGITYEDIGKVRQELKLDVLDSFALVVGSDHAARSALLNVVEIANQVIVGIPSQVRKADEDGSSSYLRPMPGSSRMYPETDVPFRIISKSLFDSLERPELIVDRASRFESLSLSKDVARDLSDSKYFVDFEKFITKFVNLKPAYIAEILLSTAKTIKTLYKLDINPSAEDFELVFEALNNEEISKESVIDIFKENKPTKNIIDKYKLMSDEELKSEITNIVSQNKSSPFNAIIGIAMKSLRGKASGKKISEFLKELI